MVITLDGPSGTGKSTLAKQLASRLNFKFLNSGMIYRAITHYCLTNNILATDIEIINNSLKDLKIDIKFIDNNQHIIINNVDCTPFVNSKAVQDFVSVFSQNLNIRKAILNTQREFARDNNIVIEGRDIGSEVFPNADKKFYVECDIIVRAKRRHADLVKEGQNISLDEVVKSLEKRDFLDSTRKYSPLIKPKDAVVIDTSTSTIEQSLDTILQYLK